MNQNIKEELLKFFKGDVDDSDETLTKYSHDASVFEIRPKVVVFPKGKEDVRNLVKWVVANKSNYPELSITARCAGTDMSGGSVGESIILDFSKYMNTLVNFDNKERIIVQPGMFYRDFEKITLEKGMILPCYTASKMINAVGGMFGNNSAGERTLKYGKTEQYILESKVVFEDGNEYIVRALNEEELKNKITQNDFEGSVYKKIWDLIQLNKEEIKNAKPNVHKNSAGYYIWNVWDEEKKIFDLNRLIVGSQGTLGIATEITFRLIPEAPYRKLLVVFLRDLALVPDLVNKILKYNPETLESYDDKTFFLVLKYIKDFAKLLGLKNLFKLMFSFGPEMMMTLQHGLPKIILLVEFTGETQEEADAEAIKTLAELKTVKGIGLRLTKDAFEAKKYWTIRHEAFNLIRYHLKKVKSKPFIDDVIVRPEKLPEFFPTLYKILGEYKKRMTFAVGGHAGDGNLHIYTLVNPKDPQLKEMVMQVSNRVYDLVVGLGGSITAEHNDGLIRTAYLGKMYNAKVLEIFKQIKEIFDPLYILNPRKKVMIGDQASSLEYMTSHITMEK